MTLISFILGDSGCFEFQPSRCPFSDLRKCDPFDRLDMTVCGHCSCVASDGSVCCPYVRKVLGFSANPYIFVPSSELIRTFRYFYNCASSFSCFV